jgi:hypothetical protein
MAGVANAKRGEARGEEKGEAVDDFALPKEDGTNPGGASGLTPRRGDPEREGPPELRHDAGEGLLRMLCRIGGGDVEVPPTSLYLHKASRMALSKDGPVRLVRERKSSSSLSVLSSSSRFASCRMGKHIS